MEIPTIQTQHLTLRAWKPEDAQAGFEILQEPDILRYFPNPRPPERSGVERYIAHHLEHWETFGYGHWAVVTRSDGCVVGWTGLEYLPELEQTEIAYLLSRRVWGRGCATEAAQAATRFAFETRGLSEIIGLVHPDNTGSVRVLEKCGMTFVDRITLWGLEMSRYRIARGEYEELKNLDQASG